MAKEKSVPIYPVCQTCKSVFKSGGNTTTVQQLTAKWIELVNQLEDRENTPCRMDDDRRNG